MIIHCKSKAVLYAALDSVNVGYYADNIRFKCDPIYKGVDRTGLLKYQVCLTVYNTSTGKGSKSDPKVTAPGVRLGLYHPRGGKARRIAAACWHAHGHWFEAILALDLSAVIEMSFFGKRKITSAGGNWHDFKRGSQAYPAMASELCECSLKGAF